MKKRYTTYETLCKLPLGGSLWGLLFFFIFTACQDEIPNDTTEVMMTFTTRAVVTQNNESDVIDIEKMNDIHVIVARQDGTVVYDGKPSVNTSNGTASVSFNTPVMTGGEDFKFFAIANESSLVNPPQNYTDINGLISHVVGDGNAIVIDKSIPQTKYWIHPVKQLLGETQYIKKTLDYLASKISVQFINNTNKTQSLSNIYITGITPNGKGRLFNQPTGEKDANGEDIYEEVYVDSDVTLDNNKITFGDVSNLSVGASSVIQHFYTYPVDADNMSSPTLYATWNETQYDLPIEINDEFITALNRNDHLKIIVTLTGQELTVNYTIADWVSHATNIGSPTPEGGYDVKDWDSGNDVVIGEEDESDEPVVPGEETIVWGENEDKTTNSGMRIELDTLITNLDSYLEVDNEIIVYVERIENYDSSIQFITNWETSLKDPLLLTTSEETPYALKFDSDILALIEQQGLRLLCNNLIITKITIKEPTTQ